MITLKSISYQPTSQADEDARMKRLVDIILGKDVVVEDFEDEETPK